MKNIGNLCVRLFVIPLLTFRYFSTIASFFGAGAAPFFTAPAPAPAPHPCMVGFFLKDRNRRYIGKLLRIVWSMDPQMDTFELEKVQFIIPLAVYGFVYCSCTCARAIPFHISGTAGRLTEKKIEERKMFWFYQMCGLFWIGKLRTETVLVERFSFFRDSRKTSSVLNFPIQKQTAQNQNLIRSRRIS